MPDPQPPVVTRFAPSPTGHLHVGGARTALINWVFAQQAKRRGHDASFILRIDDTDKARSTDQSTRQILQDLQWLGLTWDQGPSPDVPQPDADVQANQIGDRAPYFQSQRSDFYQQAIDQLLSAGRAYKCFKTQAELAAERNAARQAKRNWKYDRTAMANLSQQEIAAFEAQGRAAVIRFRMPDQAITVQDLVLGPVTIQAAELEDFVIAKSDGGPTYHLASVVDDYHMGVTHVLRAQEHLMNTPKHAALADALGYAKPSYAHMPLIINPDNSKMSKRDKAKAARQAAGQAGPTLDAASMGVSESALTAFMDKDSDDIDVASAIAGALGMSLPEIDVHDFRRTGYLPGVLLNYLALLGWSPPPNIAPADERFDLDFLIEHFEIQRINKSNAKFDREKLFRFNADSIAAMTPDAFRDALRAHWSTFHTDFLNALGDRFDAFAALYQERTRTLSEPTQLGRFFLLDDAAIEYDAKAVKKWLHKGEGAGFVVLEKLLPVLEEVSDWDAPHLEAALTAFMTEHDLAMGKLAQPLRVAVTGTAVSPQIYETLALLGKSATIGRIQRCLTLAAGDGPNE